MIPASSSSFSGPMMAVISFMRSHFQLRLFTCVWRHAPLHAAHPAELADVILACEQRRAGTEQDHERGGLERLPAAVPHFHEPSLVRRASLVTLQDHLCGQDRTG